MNEISKINVGGIDYQIEDLLAMRHMGVVNENDIDNIERDGLYDVEIDANTDKYNAYLLIHITNNNPYHVSGDEYNAVHKHQFKIDPFGVIHHRQYADGEAWDTWTEMGNYTLPVASATTLGGVRVGKGLKIDSTGVLNALGLPMNGAVKGPYFQYGEYANAPEIDTLYSSYEAGCYYGADEEEGYPKPYVLLVLPSHDTGYTGAMQIKIYHNGAMYMRTSHGGDPFTEWVSLNGGATVNTNTETLSV